MAADTGRPTATGAARWSLIYHPIPFFLLHYSIGSRVKHQTTMVG